jgi:hypothetical protein
LPRGTKTIRKWSGAERCQECTPKLANQCTIFDRDKGIGSIPPNLREKEQAQG